MKCEPSQPSLPNFLEAIVLEKQQNLAKKKEALPLSYWEKKIKAIPDGPSFYQKLKEDSAFHVICEIKKASPSQGKIQETCYPPQQAQCYEKGGASAISVLAEEAFFHGSPKDVWLVRQKTSLPLLYKDFIIDPYQLYEAKAMGADIILIIATLLTKEEIIAFCAIAKACHLDVLLELHDEADLAKIPFDIPLIFGINNRDLNTFHINLETSFTLKSYLPDNALVISESGIKTPAFCRDLYKKGFRGALIGELFMRSSDPTRLLKKFLAEVQ